MSLTKLTFANMHELSLSLEQVGLKHSLCAQVILPDNSIPLLMEVFSDVVPALHRLFFHSKTLKPVQDMPK